MTIRTVGAHRPVTVTAPPAHDKSLVAGRTAFTHLYDANQSDNINKRPGWPDQAGQVKKLGTGIELKALGIEHLPRHSKAASTINHIIKEGTDGDQSAYTLKVGNKNYLVVANFPEDASLDQLFIFDATGQHKLASATPNENTGKLIWK